MSARKKILWLVSWYPNRNDRFDGDFIQRHARAAALVHDIHILFVTEADLDSPLEEEWNHATGLAEQIIYFQRIKGLLSKARKHLVWQSLIRGAVKKYIKAHGLPDLVHVHVPWKAGLVALWIQKTFSVPFVVTEHWGIYNRQASDNYYDWSAYKRSVVARIFASALRTSAVSRYLANGIKEATGKVSQEIIPNVVDTSLFFPKAEKYTRFSFVHVSNMAQWKNAGDIINAFYTCREVLGDEIQLIMIGNRDQKYVKQAGEMGLLNESVFFRGELIYREVASEIQRCHCHVLFGNFETFSCVTAESLACGLPVIVPDAGALPELVDPSNGILVQSNNQQALRDAMIQMYLDYEKFDGASISKASTARFSYAACAGYFEKFYKQAGLLPC
ncbi:MAG: glycosyltransferase [Flavisolibacter sp.]